MKAIRKSEARFNHSITIDLANDKKTYLLINGISVVLVVVFYFIFYYTVLGIIEESSISFFYYLKSYKSLPAEYGLIFLASLIITMLLHEMIHGLFFFWGTGTAPVFGFKKLMAYAGAPDWYIKKYYYIIVTLAPLVVITTACFVLLFFISSKFSSLVFLLMVIHAASCVGDLWYTAILLNKPKETYINDSGVISIISYN